MKTALYLSIAWRIILLGSIGTIGTYLPDYLHGFFGDTFIKTQVEGAGQLWERTIDEHWEWGIRHYWYHITVITLFCLTLINVIISIITAINKHYPNTIQTH